MSPHNGSVSVSSYLVGGIATFSCSPGTKLTGLNQVNCLTSGQWNGPEPSCLCEFNNIDIAHFILPYAYVILNIIDHLYLH